MYTFLYALVVGGGGGGGTHMNEPNGHMHIEVLNECTVKTHNTCIAMEMAKIISRVSQLPRQSRVDVV